METYAKMINVDDVKKNIKELNTNHPYRILRNGGSRSRKTHSLFNLINQQSDIDKF